MEKDLKIRISIDKKTGALKVVNGEFKELSNSTKNASSSVDGFNKRLKDMAHIATSLYAVKKAFDITEDIAKTGMELESMKMSLAAAVGTTKKASKEIEFLKKTTDNLGLSFKASLSGFTQFAAAAKQTSLEGKGVEDVFLGVSEASAVMGLSVDDQNGIFRALSQMMSKGKIQAEELRGQLGERLPGAFQIASRAMEMSTSELDKYMESGKLLSDDFLPKFGKQLEKEFGEKAVTASKIARAEQNRYNNALTDMKEAINSAGINELTKDYYKLSASLIELTTKNIPEIKSLATEVGIVGASLIGAKVSLIAYKNITSVVTASNFAMGSSFGSVNRAIVFATASTKAFSMATRAIPYVALATGIYSLVKYFPKLTSETTLAEQSMNDYADSVRNASDAQLDFEITKITKKIAETSKLANDEAKKRGAYAPVSGYGETLAYELTELSKQLDILKKQKQAVKGIGEESEKNTQNKNKSFKDILKNMDASAYNGLNKMSMEINKKYVDDKKKTAEVLKKIDEETTADYIANLLEWEEEEKKQQDQEAQAYNIYTSIMGTGYDKWLQDTSDKMALLAQSGYYTNEELQKVWEKLQRDYNLNINADALSLISDPLDTLNNKFMNMYENIQKLTGADAWSPAQLQKFYSVWQKSAEKIGKENKKQAKYDGIGSQAWTAGLKGQAKQFANINNAINDLTKDQSKYNELSKEDKALNKDKYVASQVDGYSALAGAMSGVFQEGSSGAQAFQAIQATLGIVNAYTGITAAWASAPFPANLPAVAAASASLLPMISTLTSLGGSGGSSGDGTSMSVSEIAIQNTKDEYKPITGRLDRQIALLQSIDKNGSASFLGLDRAEAVYKRDYDIFTQESLSANNSWAHSSFDAAYGRYGNTDFYSAGQDRVKLEPYLKEQLGYDIFSNIGNTNNPTTTVNMDALSTDDNFVKLIALLGNKDSELAKLEQSYQSEGGAGPVSFLFDAGWEKNGRTPAEQAKFTIDNLINDYQDTLSEFTLAVNDSIKELTDGADSFKDDYDKITNSQYYANKKIVDAFNESDNAVKNWIKLSEDGSRNGLGLSDYIKDQIANIDDLQSYYTRNISDILLSQKPEDMQKQLDLVRELETKTGKVFEDGARDALDYLDSINLVAETMATSNANIKSWQNSFKTDKQKTSDMLKQINLAEKLDLKVANNYTSLDKLFDTLKGGIDGLTDVELNFLNANKDLLDSSKSTVQNVFDAWNGSLSYLSLNEKSTLSDKFYDLSKTSGSTIDSVEAARLSAEAALKSAKTQEDYIPVFDRYIHELQDNAPKNTLDDVVDELKIIADKVSELEETTRRVSV